MIVLVVTVGAGVSGCSSVRCWGARSGALNSAELAPQVHWNTTAWFASHPGTGLYVCVDRTCQVVSPDDAKAIDEMGVRPADSRMGDLSERFRLSVVARRGSTVVASSSGAARMTRWTADAGTCFAQPGYRIEATVTADASIVSR